MFSSSPLDESFEDKRIHKGMISKHFNILQLNSNEQLVNSLFVHDSIDEITGDIEFVDFLPLNPHEVRRLIIRGQNIILGWKDRCSYKDENTIDTICRLVYKFFLSYITYRIFAFESDSKFMTWEQTRRYAVSYEMQKNYKAYISHQFQCNLLEYETAERKNMFYDLGLGSTDYSFYFPLKYFPCLIRRKREVKDFEYSTTKYKREREQDSFTEFRSEVRELFKRGDLIEIIRGDVNDHEFHMEMKETKTYVPSGDVYFSEKDYEKKMEEFFTDAVKEREDLTRDRTPTQFRPLTRKNKLEKARLYSEGRVASKNEQHVFLRRVVEVDTVNTRDTWIGDIDTQFAYFRIEKLFEKVNYNFREIAIAKDHSWFTQRDTKKITMDITKWGISFPIELVKIVLEEMGRINPYFLLFKKNLEKRTIINELTGEKIDAEYGFGLGNLNQMSSFVYYIILVKMLRRTCQIFSDDAIIECFNKESFAECTKETIEELESLSFIVKVEKIFGTSGSLFLEEYELSQFRLREIFGDEEDSDLIISDDEVIDKSVLFGVAFSNCFTSTTKFEAKVMLQALKETCKDQCEWAIYLSMRYYIINFLGMEFNRKELEYPTAWGGWPNDVPIIGINDELTILNRFKNAASKRYLKRDLEKVTHLEDYKVKEDLLTWTREDCSLQLTVVEEDLDLLDKQILKSVRQNALLSKSKQTLKELNTYRLDRHPKKIKILKMIISKRISVFERLDRELGPRKNNEDIQRYIRDVEFRNVLQKEKFIVYPRCMLKINHIALNEDRDSEIELSMGCRRVIHNLDLFLNEEQDLEERELATWVQTFATIKRNGKKIEPLSAERVLTRAKNVTIFDDRMQDYEGEEDLHIIDRMKSKILNNFYNHVDEEFGQLNLYEEIFFDNFIEEMRYWEREEVSESIFIRLRGRRIAVPYAYYGRIQRLINASSFISDRREIEVLIIIALQLPSYKEIVQALDDLTASKRRLRNVLFPRRHFRQEKRSEESESDEEDYSEPQVEEDSDEFFEKLRENLGFFRAIEPDMGMFDPVQEILPMRDKPDKEKKLKSLLSTINSW
jgi:signal recognition particle subunit SEC65